MSNNFVPTESNIEKVLKKLGTEKKPYPKSLLNARRTAYLSQVTLVVSGGPHIKKGNGQGQGGPSHGAAPMTPIMKAVLTILVAANLALVSYLAVSLYENWDRVQEMVFGAPFVIETSPAPPEIPIQVPQFETTPEIEIPPDGIVVPVSTPEPTSLSEDPQPLEGDSVDNPQVSTPEPDGDNSGLHLGQTPHSPDTPPGQSSQDNTQDKTQGNQDKNKDKNK